MKTSQQRRLKFPDNILVAVTIKASPENDSPREQARTRGLNAARDWVAGLYGFGNAPKVNFKFELPTAHKPTKLEFVKLLSRVTQDFEALYKFDPSNGTHQVRAKDIPTNEAFGFFDGLNTLAENFDLWETLNRDRPFSIPAYDSQGSTSPLEVRRTTRRDAGECNFCPAHDHDVFEIGSKDRTLKIRMCVNCLRTLKLKTRRI